jgi:hypothetical protein
MAKLITHANCSTQSIQPSDFITKSPKHINMEFVGFSYGHAIFASIDISCITIVDVFTSPCISPPLCPSLFSVASQYGYYNDQIYFGVTAAMYRPLHASLSASFMAYLFGELKVMLNKSASICHIINN